MFEEVRAKGHMAAEDAEKAWKELKEGIVEVASRCVRLLRGRTEKRS